MYDYKFGELYHHGIKGMKWGVRRFQNFDGTLTSAGRKRYGQVAINKSDSSVTKRVKNDYNRMSDSDFMKKYRVSKLTYAKRVEKYGDPYMNSPLAKAGKKLAAMKKKSKNYDKIATDELKDIKNNTKKNINERRAEQYKNESEKYANKAAKAKEGSLKKKFYEQQSLNAMEMSKVESKTAQMSLGKRLVRNTIYSPEYANMPYHRLSGRTTTLGQRALSSLLLDVPGVIGDAKGKK